MANITSLYLSNSRVQAAVGRPGAKQVKLRKIAEADLPEGCLINGVITNEAALAAALNTFFERNGLPRKKVALVIESTQIMSKIFTVPFLSAKKLREIVAQELAAGTETLEQPLVDYMLLRRDKAAKKDTVMANSAEAAFIESYAALAESAGFTIGSIDTAMAAALKLVGLLPCFNDRVCAVLSFDGDNVSALLLENGHYKYASRSRLFSAHGTAALGSEVGQTLSGTNQFQLASKGQPITDVFFTGCTAEDFTVCAPECAALGFDAASLPKTPAAVVLPDGAALSSCLYTAGNLIGR